MSKEEVRTLTIDLDYELPKKAEEGEDRLEGSELTSHYINAAVTSAHPNGIEGQLRRIFGRLQRKIDKAIDEDRSIIELLPEEVRLLRKSFENCKIPATHSKFFNVLEDEIERATAKRDVTELLEKSSTESSDKLVTESSEKLV